jgi:DNA-binding NtrC family response regulator
VADSGIGIPQALREKIFESFFTTKAMGEGMGNLNMFRLFLKASGYTALLAENGQAGLEMIAQEQPSIVFTDIKMPGMDGFDVLKRIKQIYPKTEVIAMTGRGDMDLAVKALVLNATDFITKPIQRSALDAALARAGIIL